jgi:cell wall-associated NlpC family hydrolase
VRALGIAVAVALTISTGGVAVAADDGTPSRQDVRRAEAAVRVKAQDVESVRAQLVLANQRLQSVAIAAAQAAEAYNGARYAAQQARDAAREAELRSAVAAADVDRQQEVYGAALVTSYEMAPGLTALTAIAQSDGITTVIDRATTMQNAEDALDGKYDEFRASATLADVATRQAEQARAEAAAAEQQARTARDAARAAEASAAAQAQSIAAQKSELLAQLAELEHVSVALATRRQAALEARAAAAAAAAAQRAQELEQREQAEAAAQQQAQQAAQQAAQAEEPAQQPAPASGGRTGNGGSTGGPGPAPAPAPAPAPPPAPAPAPSPPPASASGAQAAISFARQQIGEPYVWGAAGPGSWDCSGLTMGAWQAGGRYLPHYSVAQYEQSTPISAGALQPGDLLFWGSSSAPSSIYHVALYVGNGQMIHAPRTGRPVTEESMYYWIPPNFYARP